MITSCLASPPPHLPAENLLEYYTPGSSRVLGSRSIVPSLSTFRRRNEAGSRLHNPDLQCQEFVAQGLEN